MSIMHIDNIEKIDECVLSFTKIGISSLRQKHWVIKVQRASKCSDGRHF